MGLDAKKICDNAVKRPIIIGISANMEKQSIVTMDEILQIKTKHTFNMRARLK
jgi:hypothetical protein